MTHQLTAVRPNPESGSDGDGNQIHNEILIALPAAEREYLSPQLEFVRLKANQVIYDQGEAVKSCYFCDSGMLSIVTVMSDARSVEVGLVGQEGFVGLPLIAGLRTINTRIICQADATVFRMGAAQLRLALQHCPTLLRQLHRFSQFMSAQASQIAVCNGLHEVDERLARWLLMVQERLGSNSLPLTHELISQMLGTRRSSVTVAAGTLQKAGLISYSRGSVTILDRVKLEQASCDCYSQLQQQIRTWQNQNEYDASINVH